MQTAWESHPAAARLVDAILDDLLGRCPAGAGLAARMHAAGLRLVDWLDHVALGASDQRLADLRSAGFAPADGPRLVHPSARLPAIVATSTPAIALRVQDLAICAGAFPASRTADAPPGAPLRRCVLAESAVPLLAVERHAGWNPPRVADQLLAAAQRHGTAFAARPRSGDMDAGFLALAAVVENAVAELGSAWASDLFFAAERARWLAHCAAGRAYASALSTLGLDLGVSDHHTFRSSRGCFARLVAVLERLGMRCRERFHAGAEAGWGAQVMEQPETGTVVFADVDLAPDEATIDFPHQGLPERDQLGTVGLWCALHGEAILAAGLHHLAVPCVHDDLVRRLAAAGVAAMPPFSDLPFLKQCFTKAERRPVDPARLRHARERGWIDEAQAARFAAEGALGAHLELAERRLGFKGFNQSAVSHIIRGTDPRGPAHG